MTVQCFLEALPEFGKYFLENMTRHLTKNRMVHLNLMAVGQRPGSQVSDGLKP
jgi:hypothetical protein